MKPVVIGAIRVYQKTFPFVRALFSGFGVAQEYMCAFEPTCAEYSKQAIERYGVVVGMRKGIRRISRCHPWQKPQHDEV